jgi:hypothetical protein
MFRHKTVAAPPAEEKKEEVKEGKVELKEKPVVKTSTIENETTIKELLEKNLKWSQIIYEQNRKINSKLLWTAIGSWLKVFLILIPLILAAIFLAPMAKNLSSLYSDLLTGGVPNTRTADSLEQMMKLLPINSAQQEQLKAILK